MAQAEQDVDSFFAEYPKSQDAQMPIELYAAQFKQPYIVDLLEMRGFYHSEIDDSRNRLDTIHKYITSEVEKRGLRPVLGSYEEVLTGVREDLGLSEFTTKHAAVEKIYVYLRASVQNSAKFSKLGIKLGFKPSIKSLGLNDLKKLFSK